MKTLTIPVLLAVFVSSLFTANASPSDTRREQEPPPPPPLILFREMDTNHDKVISAEELKAASGSLTKLDLDQDGEITIKEATTPPPREEGHETKPDQGEGNPFPTHPAPPLIKALDTNGDGSLSPEEMEQAPETLKILDKNEDGTLSREEMRPGGPPPAPPEED